MVGVDFDYYYYYYYYYYYCCCYQPPQVIHGKSSFPPRGTTIEDAHYSSTIKLSSFHPKAQRMKQLMGMIDLGMERFTVWDQTPIAPYDIYQRRLRGTAAAGEATLYA